MFDQYDIFYDVMTGWESEGTATDVVCFDFRKNFGTISYNMLLSKLIKCELDEWTVRCIET